jgi:hypothetical protein
MFPCSKRAHDWNQMVPEGQPKIAQVGDRVRQSPEGTAEIGRVGSAVLRDLTFHPCDPALKRWAVLTSSLRDIILLDALNNSAAFVVHSLINL